MSSFGKVLQGLRKRKGMSCRALARSCGKSPTSICGMEKGLFVPSADTVESLVSILGGRVALYRASGHLPKNIEAMVFQYLDLFDLIAGRVEKEKDVMKVLKDIVI